VFGAYFVGVLCDKRPWCTFAWIFGSDEKLIAAFLPELADSQAMGRVSGGQPELRLPGRARFAGNLPGLHQRLAAKRAGGAVRPDDDADHGGLFRGGRDADVSPPLRKVFFPSGLQPSWPAFARARRRPRARRRSLAPPSRVAEFLGLWGPSVKTASIFGPLTYGAVSRIFGSNHRLASLATLTYFVIGLALLAGCVRKAALATATGTKSGLLQIHFSALDDFGVGRQLEAVPRVLVPAPMLLRGRFRCFLRGGFGGLLRRRLLLGRLSPGRRRERQREQQNCGFHTPTPLR